MEESPLRVWVKAVPFTPFTVTRTIGQSVRITIPDMIILGRRWDVVAFVDEKGFDRHVIIQHAHINTIVAHDALESSTPPE